jgi:hypothetical protein
MMFAVGLWSEAKMTEIEYFCESGVLPCRMVGADAV